jgi:hypothetical protein
MEKYLVSPNTIYFETQFGNHFGFYEGSLINAFKNDTSYTYPGKVAAEFFNTILDEQNFDINLKKSNIAN